MPTINALSNLIDSRLDSTLDTLKANMEQIRVKMDNYRRASEIAKGMLPILTAQASKFNLEVVEPVIEGSTIPNRFGIECKVKTLEGFQFVPRYASHEKADEICDSFLQALKSKGVYRVTTSDYALESGANEVGDTFYLHIRVRM